MINVYQLVHIKYFLYIYKQSSNILFVNDSIAYKVSHEREDLASDKSAKQGRIEY